MSIPVTIFDACTMIYSKITRVNVDYWEIRVLYRPDSSETRYTLLWKNLPEAASLDEIKERFLRLNPDWTDIPGGGTILAFCHYLSTCESLPNEIDVKDLRMSLILKPKKLR